jgi:hypothetical protein
MIQKSPLRQDKERLYIISNHVRCVVEEYSSARLVLIIGNAFLMPKVRVGASAADGELFKTEYCRGI